MTFLFLLGAHLETRTVRRTWEALGDLLKTAPERALVVRGGEVEEVAAHEGRLRFGRLAWSNRMLARSERLLKAMGS